MLSTLGKMLKNHSGRPITVVLWFMLFYAIQHSGGGIEFNPVLSVYPNTSLIEENHPIT